MRFTQRLLISALIIMVVLYIGLQVYSSILIGNIPSNHYNFHSLIEDTSAIFVDTPSQNTNTQYIEGTPNPINHPTTTIPTLTHLPSIPSVPSVSSVPSVPSESNLTQSSTELNLTQLPHLPSLQPNRSKKVFKPKGIPFYKKIWYTLFEYYQKKQFQTLSKQRSNEQILINEVINGSKAYNLIENQQYSLLLIHSGCIDFYKQSLYIFNPLYNQTNTKTHLRQATNFQHFQQPISFPSFSDISFFFINSSYSSFFPSSLNSTWLLLTPPNSANDTMNSFYRYLTPFLYSIHPNFTLNINRVLVPFFPISIRNSSSKLPFEISAFSLPSSPSLIYGHHIKKEMNKYRMLCYRNIILSTSYHQPLSTLFSSSMDYDCYRAVGYKYFNIKPRFTFSLYNSSISFIVTSLLYQHGKSRFLSKRLNLTHMAIPIKYREFWFENMSLRDIVILFCNSDVMIRNRRFDDYFSLFLLPGNGYIEEVEKKEEWSWTEANAKLMKICFYRIAKSQLSSNVMETIINNVVKKKYKF